MENVTLTKGNAPFGSALETRRLVMNHSTVQDNRGPGSAIFALDGLELVNSTVSRNDVGGPAVEYGSNAQVLIDNSTIAFNAPGVGLGSYLRPGASLRVMLRNSIISNNGSPQQNCANYVGFWYDGTNISNDWSCADVAITPSDPALFPLAYNGGPNMTHAIPHTSPAFNKGVNCQFPEDQRYVTRDAKCDVGAFEFNDFTKVTVTIDPNVKVDAAGKALLTGTIKCTRDDAFRLALELHQDQKVGKQIVDVHSASDIPVTCGTTAKSWSATMGLTPGETFQAGAARVIASTLQTPEWVTPASATGAVKISVARK